jgi:hypothetical protein
VGAFGAEGLESFNGILLLIGDSSHIDDEAHPCRTRSGFPYQTSLRFSDPAFRQHHYGAIRAL